MTTESQYDTRPGVTVLLGTAGATLAAALLLVGLGALVDGTSGAYGAAFGGGVALLVFALGTAVVHAVSGLMPGLSLLVALMTYTLQLLAMALLFVVAGRSGLMGETISREWFAAGVIGATLVWLAAQVWRATHLRLPAYDIADPAAPADPARPEASA